MAKASSKSPRYSREELIANLDANLDRLETEQAAQPYSKLLKVLRGQTASLAKGPAPTKPLPKKLTGR